RFRIVRREHERRRSGELRGKQFAHAVEQGAGAARVLSRGRLVEEQRAVRIPAGPGEREADDQPLPLAARERRYRREGIEEAPLQAAVVEAPEEIPEDAVLAHGRPGRETADVGAGEGGGKRLVGILRDEHRVAHLAGPSLEERALARSGRSEDPLQRGAGRKPMCAGYG